MCFKSTCLVSDVWIVEVTEHVASFPGLRRGLGMRLSGMVLAWSEPHQMVVLQPVALRQLQADIPVTIVSCLSQAYLLAVSLRSLLRDLLECNNLYPYSNRVNVQHAAFPCT